MKELTKKVERWIWNQLFSEERPLKLYHSFIQATVAVCPDSTKWSPGGSTSVPHLSWPDIGWICWSTFPVCVSHRTMAPIWSRHPIIPPTSIWFRMAKMKQRVVMKSEALVNQWEVLWNVYFYLCLKFLDLSISFALLSVKMLHSHSMFVFVLYAQSRELY